MANAQVNQSHHYNLRRRPVSFAVGEKVMKKNYVLSEADKGITGKLANKYAGPYTIRRRVNPAIYELEKDGVSIGTWHVSTLKKCVEPC